MKNASVAISSKIANNRCWITKNAIISPKIYIYQEGSSYGSSRAGIFLEFRVYSIDLRTEYTPYAVRNSFNQNSRYNIIILPICVKLHYNYIILPFGIRHIIILCHVPRTFYLGTNNTFNCSSCKIGFYHEYCNIPMYTYACLYTIYTIIGMMQCFCRLITPVAHPLYIYLQYCL